MKRQVILMAALAAFAGPAVAGGGSDPQALKLIAQLKAASGGAALDKPVAFHEQGEFVRDGVPGTYDAYGDLRAMRTMAIHRFKDHVDRGGFDGHDAWRQGSDNVVRRISDPTERSIARLDAYLTLGGYFYPNRFPAIFHAEGQRFADGRLYDVVTVIPAGADNVHLWLDARSHRLARMTTDSERQAYAEVSDYRQVDGAWVGFANHETEPGHVTDMKLTSFRYTPVDPATFTPPVEGGVMTGRTKAATRGPGDRRGLNARSPSAV
jgi:hypothetical protein